MGETRVNRIESYQYVGAALHAYLASLVDQGKQLDRWTSEERSPLQLLTLGMFLASNDLYRKVHASSPSAEATIEKVNVSELRVSIRGHRMDPPHMVGQEFLSRNAESYGIDYCSSYVRGNSWFEFVLEPFQYKGFLQKYQPELVAFGENALMKIVALAEPRVYEAAMDAWWENKYPDPDEA